MRSREDGVLECDVLLPCAGPRRALRPGTNARKLQRGLDHEANRQVLDQLFTDDLVRPRDARPARRGTVMGVSRDKVHVLLDDPPIDVKVYARHLEKQRRDGPLRQGRDHLTLRRAKGGARVATVGEAVRVRVDGHDRKRDRWTLGLLPR